MSWDSRGFVELRRIRGSLVMEMMGQSMEIPYEADLFADSTGEVGAIAAQGPQGGTNWLFVTRTADGVIYTQPSPRDGSMEFQGQRLITTSAQDRDGILAAHLAAVDDSAIADSDALSAVLDDAPQAAARLAAEAMKKLAAGFAASLS